MDTLLLSVQEKSLNCQARSLGIFVALYKTGKIDAIKHFETFVEYVYTNVYSLRKEINKIDIPQRICYNE